MTAAAHHAGWRPVSGSQPVPPVPGLDDTVVTASQRLHTPPPLGRTGISAPLSELTRVRLAQPDPAVPTGDRDARLISARNLAINRMEYLSRNHARLAFESPGTPICPHALAFLYLEPSGIPKVVAAVRVVPDTPDVRELPTLLFRLARLAKDRYGPAFDPARHMSIQRDQDTRTAEYIGVGVSTLDTPGREWEKACANADTVDDLGGRIYIWLYDGSAILVDRPCDRKGRGELAVHSTGDLNYANALAHRLWRFHHNVATMPAEQEVWQRMYELHDFTEQQMPRPTL